ncbi:MAG: 5'-methylthioadenosine/adenosylhomocysteine nucleosidase [Lachnospiraceae bacterium]
MQDKKIGIIGAMEEEVASLFSAMEEKTTVNYAGWTFYEGKLMGKQVVIVRSGIGKVNMAACAQVMISVFKVTFLLNTGVAGSLDATIDIGDIVISTDCIQHDMDAVAFGYEPGVIPQMDCSVFVADEKAADLAVSLCDKLNPDIHVHRGRVLSGDVFVADKAKKEYLISRFAGKCTEMEGAAMAQVAYINHIPYLVIRAISDKADDSAKMNYRQFEIQAIKHMVSLVKGLVEVI